jgi:hypothetical protein
MKHLFCALIGSCLISVTGANAANCFTNAKEVNIGSTPGQVLDICGTSDKTITKKVSKDVVYPVTHWYYLVQFSDQLSTDSTTYPSDTLIKIAIEFYQHKVDHINVLVPVGTKQDHTAFDMLGYLISKGESEERVRLFLGQPTTLSEDTVTKAEEHELVGELLYHDGDTKDQQHFQFEEGKLVAVKADTPVAPAAGS